MTGSFIFQKKLYSIQQLQMIIFDTALEDKISILINNIQRVLSMNL